MNKIFEGRSEPPEPDDAYHYLYHIKADSLFGLSGKAPAIEKWEVNTRNSEFKHDIRVWMSFIKPYWGWTYPLGLLHSITDLNLKDIFKYSFYFGIFFSLICLLILTINLEALPRAAIIILMATFSGGGSYHGFFWMVPSFYTLCLYLALWGFLSSLENWGLNKNVLFTISFPIAWLLSLHPTGWGLCILLGSSIFADRFLQFYLDKRKLRGDWHFFGAFFTLVLSVIGAYFLLNNSGLFPQIHFSKKMLLASGAGGRNLTVNLIGFWKFLIAFYRMNKSFTWPLFTMSLYSAFKYRDRFSKSLLLQIILFSILSAILFITENPYPDRFFLFLRPFTYIFIAYGVGIFLSRNSKRWRFTIPVGICFLILFHINLRDTRGIHRFTGYHKNYEFTPFDKMSLIENSKVIIDDFFGVHYLTVAGDFEFEPINKIDWINSEKRLVDNTFYIRNKSSKTSVDKITGEKLKIRAIFKGNYWEVYQLLEKN